MTGYTLVNILGGFLIVTSTALILQRSSKRSAYIYSLQSAVLVALFIALGVTTGSNELFKWAGTAFITKVILVPTAILYLIKRINNESVDIGPSITPAKTLILVAIELFICYAVINPIALPTAQSVKPALAIALAHFFIGLTCIITQRNILKQVFGYCLMENGSHVILALLAPSAPSLVEVGVTTDAIFAVAIFCVLVYQIYKANGSLDARNLMKLKG